MSEEKTTQRFELGDDGLYEHTNGHWVLYSEIKEKDKEIEELRDKSINLLHQIESNSKYKHMAMIAGNFYKAFFELNELINKTK